MQIFRALIACAALLLGGTTPSLGGDVLCSEPVRIRVSPDYHPFSFKDLDGKADGLDVALIRDIFAEIGCPIAIEFFPFKRAIVELAKGTVDMIPFASMTPMRSRFAHFSKPYRMEAAGLILRKDEVARYPISSLEDIIRHGLVLGHERWTYRGEEFEAFLKRPDAEKLVFSTTSTTEGIRMLNAGRIDALVEMPLAAMAVADDLGLGDIFAEHPYTVWEKPVRFMFSRNTVTDELVWALNAALAIELRSARYRERYGSLALSASHVAAQ